MGCCLLIRGRGSAGLTTVNLTSDVTGILPSANGGTGIAYFGVAGPTAARIYTFPDSAATIAYNGMANLTLVTPTLGVASATRINIGTAASTSGLYVTDGATVVLEVNRGGSGRLEATAFCDRNGSDTFGLTTSRLACGSSFSVEWSSNALWYSGSDLFIRRGAAATLQIGVDVNGAAVNQAIQAANAITGSNLAGGDLTFKSGTGMGTGTVSSITFQTPTVAASGANAQSLATRITINSSGIGTPSGTDLILRGGSSFAGNIKFNDNAGNTIALVNLTAGSISANTGFAINPGATSRGLFSTGLDLITTDTVGWRAGAFGSQDVFLTRAAAATLQLGTDLNGAAINQTFQAANGITGTDKTGGNFTLASGKGTGAGTVSQVLIQTPTVLGSGTTAQSLATRLTIDSSGIKATGYLSSDGSAGVTAGPYTTITSITVKNGLITAISGA